MTSYSDYVQLHLDKKEIELKLEEKKSEIHKAEEQIMGRMAEEGLKNVKMEDGRTLWLDHKFWASPADVETVAAKLHGTENDWLVTETINRSKLSAWVREHAGPLDSPEQVQAKLPAEIRDLIKVTETNNVRVRGL